MMALICKKMGWDKNPETGEAEFLVVLVAETERDVPKLNFDVVINSRPVSLTLLDEQ